jgi:uncharacterized membrane protein YfcA
MIEIFSFLVIFGAMLIRTLTGFGSALIAIPLLSLLFGAKYAIPFIMIYECLIDLLILAPEAGKVGGDIKRAWTLLILGLLGVPLGTEILIFSSEGILKIVIGFVLIIFSLLLLWNMDLKIESGRAGFAASGLMGGFLCGSIGMPGPPMALLLSSQGMGKDEFRRLIVLFLTAIDFLTFFYFLWIGLIDEQMLRQGIILLPAVVLGYLAGRVVFCRVDETGFRRMVLGLVLGAGVLIILVQ